MNFYLLLTCFATLVAFSSTSEVAIEDKATKGFLEDKVEEILECIRDELIKLGLESIPGEIVVIEDKLKFSNLEIHDLTSWTSALKVDGIPLLLNATLSWESINARGSYFVNLYGLVKGQGTFKLNLKNVAINILANIKVLGGLEIKLLNILPDIETFDMEITDLHVAGEDISPFVNYFIEKYWKDLLDILEYIVNDVLPGLMAKSPKMYGIAECIKLF